MKKLFAFLLCVIMCLALLSSCKASEHEHTMSDWKYNETEHWREPVCGINDCIIQAEVHDLGEHSDVDENEICDVCGYRIVADQPINPTFPAEKSYEYTDFGELYTFLLVTNYPEEWSRLMISDGNRHTAFAYVWNKTDDWCSEFGSVTVMSLGGGITRIA